MLRCANSRCRNIPEWPAAEHGFYAKAYGTPWLFGNGPWLWYNLTQFKHRSLRLGRCRKNLPLCATSQPKPLFQMSSLQLGSDRSLPVHEASLESFDGAAFVDLSPISSLSLKERSLELQWLADELSGGLANLAEYFEIDPVYYHGIPCVGAALWHPAFMCREWIELMDDLLGKSSFPDTWSVHCGIQTLDTPADEYDLEADAPIINFSFLFNRSSGLVVDEISTADFLIWFNEPGIVPLSFP